MTTLDQRHGEGARDGDGRRGEVGLGPVAARSPATVPLEQPGAALRRLAGSKAAHLARAARAGLPVLPGFVIPYGGDGDTVALRRAWHELSAGGEEFVAVAGRSAEYQAINQALNAGSRPEDLRCAPPVVFAEHDDDRDFDDTSGGTQPRANKSWWQFWK